MALLENLLLGWGPALAALLLLHGAGCRLLPRRWLLLPSPWPAALAGVLGWHLAALLVLALGVCGFLSRVGLLAGFWLPLAGLTAWAAVSGRLCVGWSPGFSRSGAEDRLKPGLQPGTALRQAWVPLLLLCGVFLVVLAGIATAPPSKHDELHYHLLVPRRGLIEGRFSFPPTPYLQAAPHIAWQVLLTPLLAIGLPATAGVFSLLWGVVLVGIVFARARRVSPARGVLGAAVLLLAFGHAVWWPAGGPTAVAELWASLLFLWLFDRDELCGPDHLGAASYAAGAALLAVALFLTKVSFLLPAGAALLIVLHGQRPIGAVAAIVALTAGPWLLACGLATGNPLGFAGAGVLAPGVFDPGPLRATLAASWRANQFAGLGLADLLDLLQPLLALGLGIPVLVSRRRWDLLAVVLLSSVALVWLVPHASRFHSFTLNGLLLAAILGTPSGWFPAWMLRWLPLVVFLVALPVVAASAYYSTVFWPAAVGMQARGEFLRERTALYDVWSWCNRETPREARFCIDLSIQPRLFYLERFALSPEGLTRAEGGDLVAYMRRHHLHYLVSQQPQPGRELVLRRRFEDVVLEAYRAPGRAPQRGTVWLYQIAGVRP